MANKPHLITWRGKTQGMMAWADEMDIDPAALRKRLARWPLDRAMTEPRHNKGRGATIDHETVTWSDLMPYYDAARGIAYILARDANRLDEYEDIAHDIMLELVTTLDKQYCENRSVIIDAIYKRGKTLLYQTRAASERLHTESLEQHEVQ